MRWAALLRGVNVGGNRKLRDGRASRLSRRGWASAPSGPCSPRAMSCSKPTRAMVPGWRGCWSSAAQGAAGARYRFPAARCAPSSPTTIARQSLPGRGEGESEPPDRPVRPRPASGRPGRARWPNFMTGRNGSPSAAATLFIDYREGMGRSRLAPALAKLRSCPGPTTGRNWNTVLEARGDARGLSRQKSQQIPSFSQSP